jgi:hypothetical protein
MHHSTVFPRCGGGGLVRVMDVLLHGIWRVSASPGSGIWQLYVTRGSGWLIITDFSVFFSDFRDFSPFLCRDVWNEARGENFSTFMQTSFHILWHSWSEMDIFHSLGKWKLCWNFSKTFLLITSAITARCFTASFPPEDSGSEYKQKRELCRVGKLTKSSW